MSFATRQAVGILCLLVLCAWGFPLCVQAENNSGTGLDPRVKSGATIVLDFPELPDTLGEKRPELLVRIPENFDPDRRYPLFLWMNGGAGNPSLRTDLVGKEDYICISMPLFHDPEFHPKEGTVVDRLLMRGGDIEALWHGWKTMLAKLEMLVPNIERRKGVAAGFSNGTRALGIALSHEVSARGFQRYFRTFVLIDGAIEIYGLSHIKGRSMLIVNGETSMGPGSAEFRQALRKHKADADLIIMKGHGHEFPAEFAPKVKEWIAAKAKGAMKSPVPWKTAELVGGLSRKEESALAEYFGKQDFMSRAKDGRPVLIYCISDAGLEDKGGRRSPGQREVSPEDLCDYADEQVFSFHPGTLGLPVAAECFECFRLDVSEIAPETNCQVNWISAPVVILMGSDQALALVLKGDKIRERTLLEAMKKQMSKEDCAKINARIAGLAPSIGKLKALRKELDKAVKVADRLSGGKKKPDEKKAQKIEEAEGKVAALEEQYAGLIAKITEEAKTESPSAFP